MLLSGVFRDRSVTIYPLPVVKCW